LKFVGAAFKKWEGLCVCITDYRFNSSIETHMRKAAHPSGSMGSSNPRRLRGEWLHHHGDDVCHVVCAFCAVSDL